MPRSSALLCLILALLPLAALRAQSRAKPPNIVFILVDDMGWADVGCNGSTFYETPNVDRLASQGMRFTDAYAACPVCSPTRASILTGRYPARIGLTDFLKGRRARPNSPILPAEYLDQLPLEELTLAEALKPAGYRSASVGKWHLGGGPFLPQGQGFDVNVAGSAAGSPAGYFFPYRRGQAAVPLEGGEQGEYLTDRLTTEAIRFIEAGKEQPFFLYLPYYAVHIPLQARMDKQAKYEAKLKAHPPAEGQQNNPVYAAMVESVDDGVGRIVDALRRLNLEDRTIVVFFADNGGLSVKEGPHTPATTNAPLRGGKGCLYEGGIREPMIVRWPGVVKPGTVCRAPVDSVDFFPTFCEAAGVKLDQLHPKGPLDGLSLLPLLRNPGARLRRDALYWHYPHFSNQGGDPGGAIRSGDWKLIEGYEFGKVELYNLKQDLSERHDLAAGLRTKAEELRERLHAWLNETHANMPLPNPAYRAK